MIPESQDVEFFGDHSIGPMQYGPLKRNLLPFPPILQEIKKKLDHFWQISPVLSNYRSPLNAVLVNYYKNGKDSMGYHSDIEPALGARPILLSLSLGAVQKFNFQHKQLAKQHSTFLRDGTVLIMLGSSIQENWKHGLPKDKNISSDRWNLSFWFHLSATDVTHMLKLTGNDKSSAAIKLACKLLKLK